MHVIELDTRRRTSFGRIGRKEHTRYIVDEQPDGSMLLTPAIVIPANLSPERMESIQRGIAQAHAGQTTPASEVLAALGLAAD